MALILGVTQPHLLSSSIRHHDYTKPRFSVPHRAFHFASSTNRIGIVLPRRRILVTPLKSASSIDGVSVQTNPEALIEEEDDDRDFLNRFSKWVSLLPSILPGGRWWDFDDDVEVQDLAKPVTVWRALGKMWQLISHDRWVVFAAFSALILAAVRIFWVSN